uniref:Ribosomal protein L5 n=1 Tax=Nitzschia sp. (in: diatoms) TaxID=1884248 RepID=A0A2U9GJC1_9STRA|nr:ribosomal protein L5 [Nitzschia sp. (in: diatoms)]AWQ64291.1 ribosomal protein L5 [Nitzschia sp. (in: diatoms)]
MLENYYKKVIQYDLINKFSYTHLDEIPKLKKIILNFGCKNSDIKNLASALFSLELITTNQGSLVKSKRSNILLKIRKGNPVGCVVVLKKEKMYNFCFKLISKVFPSLKDFKGIKISKKLGITSFSFTLKDLISFKELEKQFYLFINLPPLNIILVTNSKTREELIYLLHSFKIPLI